jgi:hypothetical protein
VVCLDELGFDSSGGEPAMFPARDFECPAAEPSPCERDRPRLTEEQRTVPVGSELDGETLTYLVYELGLSHRAAHERGSMGFDLDAAGARQPSPSQ